MKKELSKDIVKSKLNELDFNQPLSLKKIRSKTKINDKLINKKYILRFLYKSKEYRNVDPLEVGSGKFQVNVWTRV
jgi:hypothetical protein